MSQKKQSSGGIFALMFLLFAHPMGWVVIVFIGFGSMAIFGLVEKHYNRQDCFECLEVAKDASICESLCAEVERSVPDRNEIESE